jgi:hypothetical protein
LSVCRALCSPHLYNSPLPFQPCQAFLKLPYHPSSRSIDRCRPHPQPHQKALEIHHWNWDTQVKVSTEKECALGVSFYPDFAYNAEGGGGTGKVTAMDIDGKVAVSFDPLSLSIPALVRPCPPFHPSLPHVVLNMCVEFSAERGQAVQRRD